MEAIIRPDSKGDVTIYMKGNLSFDFNKELRDELFQVCENNPTAAITIDMQSVNFVGSSGIAQFVETIDAIHKGHKKFKLEGVSSEFQKVFKLFNFHPMKVMNDAIDSDYTEGLAQQFAARKRTFEN